MWYIKGRPGLAASPYLLEPPRSLGGAPTSRRCGLPHVALRASARSVGPCWASLRLPTSFPAPAPGPGPAPAPAPGCCAAGCQDAGRYKLAHYAECWTKLRMWEMEEYARHTV